MQERGKDERPRRSRKKEILQDDDFSRSLKAQGEEGRIMAMLYLRNEMLTYSKKVNDEPIQH